MNNIYITSGSCITPIGNNISSTKNALKNNLSGIKLHQEIGFNSEDFYVSKIDKITDNRFFSLLNLSCIELKNNCPSNILNSEKTIVLVSSTKGDINNFPTNPFEKIGPFLIKNLKLKNDPIIISNACISGVVAINHAAKLIKSNQFDHVIVFGIDIVSDFVLYGFQSLFALSNEITKPFDKNRNGINLGEACCSIILSKEKINQKYHALYLGGSSSNDANHISGPSRTGEGLYRSIIKTISIAKINISDIDYISAHGTGTIYNDEMESNAFDRLQLSDKDINSLKGYFGHTLGAAGILETIVCLFSMEEKLLFKSLGLENIGVSKPLKIIPNNFSKDINYVLKTASGFGGGNASLLLKTLNNEN